MKTSIDLDTFSFSSRNLYKQITDDPNTGFIRVIVSERTNILDDIKQIELVAKTYYISKDTNKIIPQMTHETLSNGERWIISNNYKVILTDQNNAPMVNPDYDEDKPVSDENQPYLMMPAYDRFAMFLFSETSPVPLPFIWKMNVDLDDARGYFDVGD